MIRSIITLLPDNLRPTLRLHLALTVLSVILRAAAALLLVPVVAELFSPDPAGAWPWIGALALVIVTGWLLDWWISRIAYRMGFALLNSGQRTLADRLAQVPLTWFTAENTAAARQAIASTGPELVGIFVYLVTPIIGALLLPVAIAAGLLFYSWPLGLAALIGAPLLAASFAATVRIGRSADQAASKANSALTERIVEFARTQQALRAARRVDNERSQVGQALASQHSSVMRLLLMQIPGQLIFSLATQLALLLLAGAVIAVAMSGGLGAPEAIAMIIVIARYLEPFTTLAELSGGIETTTSTLGRIRAIVEAPLVRSGSEQLASSAAPEIELRDVSFDYGNPDIPVLAGLNLTLQSGSTTAIVGPSGSGKSTILSLIAALHDPSSGKVLVDGVDAAELQADTRTELVSAVFQHPYLFDGSVRENVLTGHPTASDEQLSEVARLARIDTLIAHLPDGWEQGVGEGGKTLSGGERQRVSIARALLKPAPILIIDEATSALDTENETAITAALTSDSIPRTRIIVAHRLASIRSADRVIFIDEGKILEDGTIEQLLAAGGRFAEFWRGQNAASGWRLRVED
ncbi:MAG: ABC transporter ATP-binding protein [Ancrocorticia sp.]